VLGSNRVHTTSVVKPADLWTQNRPYLKAIYVFKELLDAYLVRVLARLTEVEDKFGREPPLIRGREIPTLSSR